MLIRSLARTGSSLVLLASLCFSSSGCGSAEGDGYSGPRGSVSGKIEYTGKTVPAGSVVLFQATKGSFTAAGKTDDKGEYKLQYNGKAELPAVTYKVQISAPPAAPVAMDPANVGKAAVPTSPFPPKYQSSSTSTWEFTVKAGANTADFLMVD